MTLPGSAHDEDDRRRSRRGELRALLLAYAAADERESAFVGRMLALLDVDAGRRDDVFARVHFSPGHFTASAFVLSPAGDELFLIRHPKLGLWLQPGGHVEDDDPDVLAAARRETREEVGLHDAVLHEACLGIFDVDIHAIPARADEPRHEHFDVRFLFRAPSKEAVKATAEVKGGRWVSLDDVEAAGSDESVERAARKAKALLQARTPS